MFSDLIFSKWSFAVILIWNWFWGTETSSTFCSWHVCTYIPLSSRRPLMKDGGGAGIHRPDFMCWSAQSESDQLLSFSCFHWMFLTSSTEQNLRGNIRSSTSAASRLVDPVPHMDRAVRGCGQERPWPLGMPDVGGDEDAIVRLRWNCVTAMLEQRLSLLQLRPPDWRVVDLNGSTETCQKETNLLLHLVSWSFSTITDQHVSS